VASFGLTKDFSFFAPFRVFESPAVASHPLQRGPIRSLPSFADHAISDLMNAAWKVVLAGLVFAGSAMAGEVISFKKLPVGDTLEVAFTTAGCFHSAEYSFAFERGKTMTVTISEAGPVPRGKKKRSGKITVSGWDLAGLDRLMKFYRSDEPGGCTTIDNITLVQKRGGKVVAEEKYSDATCGTYGKLGLLLFPALAKRALPEEP
jgi:hypothetical protein